MELCVDPTKYQWHEILRILENLYTQLRKDKWASNAARHVTRREFSNVCQANNLTVRSNNGKRNKKGNKNRNIKCYDCGAEGQVKGHDGCTKKGQGLFTPTQANTSTTTTTTSTRPSQPARNTTAAAQQSSDQPQWSDKFWKVNGKAFDPFKNKPQSGAPTTITLDNGKKAKYCATCGRWWSGDNPHDTKGHKTQTTQHLQVPIHSSDPMPYEVNQCGVLRPVAAPSTTTKERTRNERPSYRSNS